MKNSTSLAGVTARPSAADSCCILGSSAELRLWSAVETESTSGVLSAVRSVSLRERSEGVHCWLSSSRSKTMRRPTDACSVRRDVRIPLMCCSQNFDVGRFLTWSRDRSAESLGELCSRRVASHVRGECVLVLDYHHSLMSVCEHKQTSGEVGKQKHEVEQPGVDADPPRQRRTRWLVGSAHVTKGLSA